MRPPFSSIEGAAGSILIVKVMNDMTRYSDVCKHGNSYECITKNLKDYEKSALIDCQKFIPQEPAYFLVKLAETLQEREAEHGDKGALFEAIAIFWERYIKTAFPQTKGLFELNPVHVSDMMGLFKYARLAANPYNDDSRLDVAGYAACGAELASAMAKGGLTDE